jgi:hypothetical protein
MEVYAWQIHMALWNPYVFAASFEHMVFAKMFNSWVWKDNPIVSAESLSVTETANHKLLVQPSSRTSLVIATTRKL